MNEELKNAILQTIKCSTIEYRSVYNVVSYSINKPKFALQFDCTDDACRLGFNYGIKYNNRLLAEVYVPNAKTPGRSALAVDVLEIWNAVLKKHHEQQRARPMTDIQQIALKNILADLEHRR